MIVRYQGHDERDTFVPVPADMVEQVGNLTDLAEGLLSLIPGAARIQVWADGGSFMDAPDAEARLPVPDRATAPTDLVIDIATAVMLTQADHATNPQTGAPPWLTRGAACMPSRREVLRGRATGHIPSA